MKLPFFCLFTLILLIPSLKVCCTSQLAVNWSMDNTWDTRLSKHPRVRRTRLNPTWWSQRLAASKVLLVVNGEGGVGLEHVTKLWARCWRLLLGDFMPCQRSIPCAGIQLSTGDFSGQLTPAFRTSHGHLYQARPFYVTQERAFLHVLEKWQIGFRKKVILGAQEKKREQEKVYNLYGLLISEF